MYTHMIEENNVPMQESVDQQIPEQVEAQTEAIQEEKKPVENSQDRNWAEARKALKELRAQNEELRAYVSQMNIQKQNPQEEENISPDDWITQKNLQRELQSLRAEMRAKEADTVMDRLKSKFSDFDDVVTQENVDYLKEHDPELAASIQSLSGDPYQQGLAAYKLLKKTDYYLNRETMKEKKQIENNLNKPPSVNQVRKSGALAEANRFDRGLTPELKKQLWAEMQEARKGS